MATPQAVADLKAQRQAIEARLAALKAEREKPREDEQLASQLDEVGRHEEALTLAADEKALVTLRDGFVALLGEVFARLENLEPKVSELVAVEDAFDALAEKVRDRRGAVPKLVPCSLPVFGTSVSSARRLLGLLRFAQFMG